MAVQYEITADSLEITQQPIGGNVAIVEMDVTFIADDSTESSEQHYVVNSLDPVTIHRQLSAAAFSWNQQHLDALAEAELPETVVGLTIGSPVNASTDEQEVQGAVEMKVFGDTDADGELNGAETYSVECGVSVAIVRDLGGGEDELVGIMGLTSIPNGEFETNLTPGNYMLGVMPEPGFVVTSSEGSEQSPLAFTVTIGGTTDVGDIGIAEGGIIQLHGYIDPDGNGNQEGDNTGVPNGAYIEVTDAATQTTQYEFEEGTGSANISLLAGTYDVEIIVPEGYELTQGTAVNEGEVVVTGETNNLGNFGFHPTA